MSIIKDLITKIDKLQDELEKLKEKNLKLETKISTLSNNSKSHRIIHSSPSVTRSLDANNIYMGEKGTEQYANHAKMPVFYDDVRDQWVTYAVYYPDNT